MGPNVNAFEKDLEEFVNDVRCQKEDAEQRQNRGQNRGDGFSL